jgi:serine/threonine protein kinase
MPLIDTRSGKTKTVLTYYEVTDLLGMGRFSEVYKAYDLFHKTDVALKIYNNTDESAGEIAKAEEATLSKLAELNSDYFPRSKGIRLFNRHPMIPMELGEFIGKESIRSIISLKDIMPNVKTAVTPKMELLEFWEQDVFFQFILDLCDAVRLLHKCEIIHRDIKPANILLKKSAGEEHIKPFLLDFNTSARCGTVTCMGGTECYLPPEVVSGKRTEPRIADDLWALSLVIWELLFGIGQKVDKKLDPHRLLGFKPPTKFMDIVFLALSAREEDRYLDAETFYNDFNEALFEYKVEIGVEKVDDKRLFFTQDQVIWAQESKPRINEDILGVLSGENEIPVLKETKDRVAFIYSLIIQEESSSFNLKSEIEQLGTKAIPAIIEESYKIPVESSIFEKIAEALFSLAEKDRELAVKTINMYCVASDYCVRKLCFSLCKRLRYFPTILIESILEDDALYLPSERVDIADLCIMYSDDDSVMLPLNKYMCREYILDRNKYSDLKDKIASRAKELNFEKKAELIVEDTKVRIWEELKEYEELDGSRKEEIDDGLLQLFGDAFAFLEEGALDYIKRSKLPSVCNEGRLKIASTFMGKLARKYPPARKWLFEELKKMPEWDKFVAARSLKRSFDREEKGIFDSASKILKIDVEDINIQRVFNRYIEAGMNKDLRILRYEGEKETINLIEQEISGKCDNNKLEKILCILREFKNAHRFRIVKLICNNWETLAGADYAETVYVLTEFSIPDESLRLQALRLLDKGLHTANSEIARAGIDQILKEE